MKRLLGWLFPEPDPGPSPVDPRDWCLVPSPELAARIEQRYGPRRGPRVAPHAVREPEPEAEAGL